MDIQDESLKLIEIIKISKEIIEINNNNNKNKDITYNNNNNVQIFLKSNEILNIFNDINILDKIRIIIALGCNEINILEFNLTEDNNFGTLINDILKSWIILAIEENNVPINLPKQFQDNIIYFIKADKAIKEDKLRKLMENHNFMTTYFPNNVPKIWNNDKIIQIYDETNKNIVKLIKRINADRRRFQTKLMQNIKILNYKNNIDYNLENNWLFSTVDTKKRCYSYNKRKMKIKNCAMEQVNCSSYNYMSWIIRRIKNIIDDDDITKIFEIKYNTKIKLERIINWYRTKYPLEYIQKYKYVLEYYIHAQLNKPIIFIDNWQERNIQSNNINYKIINLKYKNTIED